MLRRLKKITLATILAASSLAGCDYSGVDNIVKVKNEGTPSLQSSGECNPQDRRSFYPDNDGDGYGIKAGSIFGCFQPQGYVSAEKALDCNDKNNQINPDAVESCNNLDDNCNGQVDEGLENNIADTSSIPRNIQIVMDNSGSMSVVDLYRIRFAGTADAVKGSEEWKETYSGRVAVFGSDVQNYGSFTNNRQVLANTLLTAEYADVGVTTDFVKIFSDMISNLSGDETLNGSQRVILYVGDGQPTDNEGYLLDPEKITELNQLAVDNGVNLYSLTLEKSSPASTAMDNLTSGIGYNLPLDLQGMNAVQSSAAVKLAVEELLGEIEQINFRCYDGVPEPILDY